MLVILVMRLELLISRKWDIQS